MFSIGHNATVKMLWNVSLSTNSSAKDTLFDACYFAFDTANQIVYVPTEKYLQGIDAHNGTRSECPNDKYAFFTTLDYDPTMRTLYGVCTGNRRFNWCELELENKSIDYRRGNVVFRFDLPDSIELSPTNCMGDYIAEENLFFYQTGATVRYAHGLNTSSGKVIWSGLTNGSCVNYDVIAKRLYAVVPIGDLNDHYALFLVHGDGKEQEKILDFPMGFALASVGTCAMSRSDRTLFVLMRNYKNDLFHTMPGILFAVDLDKYKLANYSLPVFENYEMFKFVSHLMYVPDSLWIK